MGLSLSPSPRIELRTRLSHRQSLELKTLLQLKLIHEPIPEATRGLEGMLCADAILKSHCAVGVLIGGLSEAVWNYRATPEKLYSEHKDVDVLALDEKFSPQMFEGGIDWWLQYSKRISARTDSGSMDMQAKWYANGFGVVLNFGVDYFVKNLSPGLYIPSRDFVIDMRSAETDLERGELEDSEVWDRYLQQLDKRIGKRMPKFVREQFAGRILSWKYSSGIPYYKLKIASQDKDVIRAIRGPERVAEQAKE